MTICIWIYNLQQVLGLQRESDDTRVPIVIDAD